MDSHPLDHIAVYVPDLDEAKTVMTELLGYEEQAPVEARPISLRVWRERGRGFHLVLCQVTHHEDVDRADPTYQWAAEVAPAVHHFAHRVPAVEAALERAGLETITPIASDGAIRQVFVKIGSDGVVHELIERVSADAQFNRGNVAELLKGKSEVPAAPRPRSARRK